MIGMVLRDPISGLEGPVEAVAGSADGKLLVRIDDHWFLADDLVG